MFRILVLLVLLGVLSAISHVAQAQDASCISWGKEVFSAEYDDFTPELAIPAASSWRNSDGDRLETRVYSRSGRMISFRLTVDGWSGFLLDQEAFMPMAGEGQAIFSPNGNSLAIMTYLGVWPNWEPRVFVFSSLDGNPEVLDADDILAFSPNSKVLLFSKTMENSVVVGRHYLSEGGAPQETLTFDIVWSADWTGQGIFLNVEEEGLRNIVKVDEIGHRNLFCPQMEESIHFHSVNISGDGSRIALVWQDIDYGQAIVVLNPHTGEVLFVEPIEVETQLYDTIFYQGELLALFGQETGGDILRVFAENGESLEIELDFSTYYGGLFLRGSEDGVYTIFSGEVKRVY